ncbi:uncharacterized protein RCO7_06232 [Rhynchosporium graminicola]|uniref:Uncharacterized protein n=1 Tax=Rhynchosporium graminicola TaxID=2792576 RepID=A0A1E1KWI3_9HELO|nr:uncharacterized protein RCO7_06232 [Rhynchosporium commune]
MAVTEFTTLPFNHDDWEPSEKILPKFEVAKRAQKIASSEDQEDAPPQALTCVLCCHAPATTAITSPEASNSLLPGHGPARPLGDPAPRLVSPRNIELKLETAIHVLYKKSNFEFRVFQQLDDPSIIHFLGRLGSVKAHEAFLRSTDNKKLLKLFKGDIPESGRMKRQMWHLDVDIFQCPHSRWIRTVNSLHFQGWSVPAEHKDEVATQLSKHINHERIVNKRRVVGGWKADKAPTEPQEFMLFYFMGGSFEGPLMSAINVYIQAKFITGSTGATRIRFVDLTLMKPNPDSVTGAQLKYVRAQMAEDAKTSSHSLSQIATAYLKRAIVLKQQIHCACLCEVTFLMMSRLVICRRLTFVFTAVTL